ncbi:hypothetical protein [Zhongshania marina]|uniref:hypothetical protein n=1 Tax=Zhongshania marina TaxID=2304603 RepID=UPI000F44FE55
MKLSKTLILLACLGLAASGAYADHRSAKHVDAHYYKHHNSHHGHHKHYKKHRDYDRYYNNYYTRHNNRHYEQHYYVRHVHDRHCGHHYQPAFNTRVKVFLGL